MVSAGPKSEEEPSVCIQAGIKGFCWVSVTEPTPHPILPNGFVLQKCVYDKLFSPLIYL